MTVRLLKNIESTDLSVNQENLVERFIYEDEKLNTNRQNWLPTILHPISL